MKNITIFGTIGRDAQTRQAGSDQATSVSVAVDDGFGQNKKTIWFDVTIWGSRGERVAQYLTKGKQISVTGDLSTREHNGKTYLTIRASDFSFAKGQQQEQRPARDPQAPVEGFDTPYGGQGNRDFDSEIPF